MTNSHEVGYEKALKQERYFMQIRTWDNGGGWLFPESSVSQEDRKRGVLPQTFFSLCHFYFRNIKDRFFSARLRHSNTSGFLSDTKAYVQPLHSLAPPMLDPGGWSHLFLNWSGTTARQLSLTGLHYFRVTKHWEMVITDSACPRLGGCAGLSHTMFCLRKEPQPERSKSQNGRKHSNCFPARSPPTPT